MTKVIIDTNVILSGLLVKKSNPSIVVDLALKGKNLLVLYSEDLYAEYKEVLNRKKFSKILSPQEIERFLTAFKKNSFLIETKSIITDCKDPKDNMLFELALDGKADCIITGDKLVLELDPFRNIRIFTPADFLNWFNYQNNDLPIEKQD